MFDIKWLSNGIRKSVKGPLVGNIISLQPLATITIGSKWEVDEARRRALRSDIGMELFQTFVEKG